MAHFDLPDLPLEVPIPYGDALGVLSWLKTQPQAQPERMQQVLLEQIAAVDASSLEPAARLNILDVLRGSVVLVQQANEARYAFRPLPLNPAEDSAWQGACRLWRALAVAYLRVVPRLAAAEVLRPLQRAALALRMEQQACFMAGQEVPLDLLRCLYDILLTGESLNIQRMPVTDPEYKFFGEAHLAGFVAWAFLMQFAEPYGMSASQFAVANRALSRWRELAGFQAEPEEGPRARALPLAALIGEDRLPQGGLRWLDVRPVARKIRKRIEALEAGESPESLNLGRELSSRATIALLRKIDSHLLGGMGEGESGEISLVFGLENIYSALAGHPFDMAGVQVDSKALSHQRMAVFGFDNRATMPTSAHRVDVPRENWLAVEGWVWRAAAAGRRLQTPCLTLAWGGAGFVGSLNGLRASSEGQLMGYLRWYHVAPLPAVLKAVPGSAIRSRQPALLLPEGDDLPASIIVSAALGLRTGTRLELEDAPVGAVSLGEVLIRGNDFVRYAWVPEG